MEVVVTPFWNWRHANNLQAGSLGWRGRNIGGDFIAALLVPHSCSQSPLLQVPLHLASGRRLIYLNLIPTLALSVHPISSL